ncbi:hypothetical protein D3C83_91510 [compost metagenome]
MTVLAPAGRLPAQSIELATGAAQLKPFEPSAPTKVAPALGRSILTWTSFASCVPPFTATTVYFRP